VIFVTVGTQLPFDRLVKAVDAWAGDNGEAGAFAQIGSNAYKPANMDWAAFLPVDMFRRKLEAASLVVSHAGVGNLLLALQAKKPILIMPRREQLNETRNDHQLATAKWLRQMTGVTVVDDTTELTEALRRGEWKEPGTVRAEASPELLTAVREFIQSC
jgi:UDP-N-acetylglucosamine transferase subunit ALG13